MPVKVRCSGCQKILNAPDAARGKAIRCPDCQTAVRVPVAAGAAKAKPAGRKAPARRKAGDADFLAGIDVNRLEDQSRPICPKCGADIYEDDLECPSCGIDLATGRVPDRVKKKQAMRGPDPALFYKAAWVDSWNFLITHKRLAVRTAFYWTLFVWLMGGAGYMVTWCTRTPPKVFWGGLTTLLLLGSPGWAWTLLLRIVRQTMAGADNYKRLNFDFYLCLALGTKAIIWPAVLALPVMPFILVPAMIAGVVSSILGGYGVWFYALVSVYLLPYTVFPIAMVHMSMPHTYKAWLPWEMIKLAFKNFLPNLYWLVMASVLMAPAGVVIGLLAWRSDVLMEFAMEKLHALTLWISKTMGTGEIPGGFMYNTILVFNVGWSSLLVIMPTAFLSAIPAVFLMRAIGLFGYYNRESLELVNRTKENQPAGFGARYLATLVDTVVLGIIYFGIQLFATMLAAMAVKFGIYYLAMVFYVLGGLAYSSIVALYYIRSESDIGQGTIGKRSLGLIVTDMKGERITPKAATARFFARPLSAIPLNLGYLLCAFRADKMTLHDLITKTQVLWKGDDETDAHGDD